jgi:selT/selW/selH-like putative selenoprotein|tara:strand:- start:53 stop:259 length:207 start_codon:yes stop_codon:yes gene_type:complete
LRDDLVDEFYTSFDEFEVELIQSEGGVFEVMVNDHLQVFSKKQLKRFPNSSYEIIKTINDALDERRLG